MDWLALVFVIISFLLNLYSFLRLFTMSEVCECGKKYQHKYI